MKVLVTGGLGQVGSHVCELLLQRGDSVILGAAHRLDERI